MSFGEKLDTYARKIEGISCNIVRTWGVGSKYFEDSIFVEQQVEAIIFSITMSRRDFTKILRYIRFDNRNQRSQLLQTDKFALGSAVWYRFIENSQNCFKPGAYITVDEQLFPSKARCRFTQYMPNKPQKFGIKFWLASDVETKYVVNGFPYLGKDETRNASTHSMSHGKTSVSISRKLTSGYQT